ncbi:Ff.00g089140.m01.CDS01 [Fusarium sp. VM40]|nr:Ff.00g089140.m01.CDS01 [Fusarium sp. VM40]
MSLCSLDEEENARRDSRFQIPDYATSAWSSGTGTGTGDAINRLSPGDPSRLSPQIEACKGLLCPVSHAVNYTKFE